MEYAVAARAAVFIAFDQSQAAQRTDGSGRDVEVETLCYIDLDNTPQCLN